MFKLKEIHIENLASIEKEIFKFPNNLDVIVGINLGGDNLPENVNINNYLDIQNLKIINNLPSNGSGKSTILEALHLILLNSPIRPKVTNKELIRKGESNCKIKLIAENKSLNLEEIIIQREYFLNKTSITKIWEKEEGKELKEIPKSLSENQDSYILNHYIGISKEDLDNFFIIQKDKFVPFFLLSDKKKKEILAKFSGIDKYSFVVNESIQKEIKCIEEDIKEIEDDTIHKEGRISSLKEILEGFSSKEHFEENKRNMILKIEETIKSENKNILEIEKKIQENKSKLIQEKKIEIIYLKRQEKISNFISENPYKKEKNDLKNQCDIQNDNILEISSAIEEAEKILNEKNGVKENLLSKKQKIESLLKNLIECPYCKKHFSPSNNKKEEDILSELKIFDSDIKKQKVILKEINEDIKELKLLKEKEKKTLNNLEKSVFSVNKKINKLNKISLIIDNGVDEVKYSINKINNLIKKQNDEILKIKEYLLLYEKDIEEIKNRSYDSDLEKILKYKNKIIDLNKDIENNNLSKGKKEENIQFLKDCLVNYTSFENYLYKKIIEEVEYIANYYLSSFSNLRIELRGNKTLSDGKTNREEINCILIRNNKEISYFLLSSGERAFVDIAFILTFQKIINISSNNGFNFLALDEITGTIDTFNQDKILKCLNNLNKPMLFISHVPVSEEYGVSYIIKNKNLSKIIQNN